jgi:YegS/Rv2252/BmrU family lipid kinase
MERQILYIINPISGTGNKQSIREVVEARTKAAGIAYEIYPSVANGDYSFLHHVIEENGVTDVVIAGGDGTINQVINALRQFNVQFGIIPCGSGNGLAFSANIPKNPDKALDIIFGGEARWTDAFTINGTFACMLCGLGFDAQVAHDFANDPSRGLATYMKQTIKNFFSAKAYTFKINTHGKEWITDAFFISVANSNQFGNHFTIAPQASLTDGMLDIVIMTRQSKLSMLLQAALQVTGFNQVKEIEVLDEQSSVVYFQTADITITNAMEAPLHIDGDPAETAKEFEIRLLHQCFRLLYPGT